MLPPAPLLATWTWQPILIVHVTLGLLAAALAVVIFASRPWSPRNQWLAAVFFCETWTGRLSVRLPPTITASPTERSRSPTIRPPIRRRIKFLDVRLRSPAGA